MLEPKIRSISSSSNSTRQDVFPFEQWTVTTRKGIILQSQCTCQSLSVSHDKSSRNEKSLCNICECRQQLPRLHAIPDMVFNENLLRLEHYSGVGIEFNALDALKQVEEIKDPLRVAVASGWQSARTEFPFARSIAKPFDWTFTTNYRGTLLSSRKDRTSDKATVLQDLNDQTSQETILTTQVNSTDMSTRASFDVNNQLSLQESETEERINLNKLRSKEEILFYDDVTLYEDELADHGSARYNVKIRVMPKSLFILARFYLRVDGVLARINDTRIYHELRSNYLLREYTNREAKISSLHLPISILTDPNALMSHLPLIESSYDKLSLPSD